MRALIMLFTLTAGLTMAAQTVPCDQSPNATLQSMSVAQLESAGDNCRTEKNYEQAIKYFDEAIHKEKKNAKLYNKRGLAELSTGAYAAAKADFLKATRYNRKYPEAWNDLGVVSYVSKDYVAAIRYFQKALALDDLRPNFHVNLGIAYFAQDERDLAMQQYTRALELDPDALMRSTNGGMSALIADRNQRAQQDFMMARVYARLGQVDRCLACLEKAKENGYSGMDDVYKDYDFLKVRKDARLATIVPPPAPQK